MTLALANRKLRTTGRPDAPARTDLLTARRQLDEALAGLRRLVRGIYPPILTDRGLAAARKCVVEVERRGARTDGHDLVPTK